MRARRAVAGRHPEHGAVVHGQARRGGPAVPVDADGAEGASSVAAGDADGEPGVESSRRDSRDERSRDTADIGAEGCVGLVNVESTVGEEAAINGRGPSQREAINLVDGVVAVVGAVYSPTGGG